MTHRRTLLSLAAAAAFAVAAPSANADVSFEAEAMTAPKTVAWPRSDAAASGGQHLVFASNGAAEHTLTTTPSPAPARLFAPSSVWNAPLPANHPVHHDSDALVSELRRLLTVGDPWINTTSYSTPVYRVPADQPTVKVVLDSPHDYFGLQAAIDNAPIPDTARPAGGTDKHLVIHQPETDTMWEYWAMEKRDGVWHAQWGGKMSDVSTSPGYFDGAQRRWGATATSLPLMGGLITLDDLRRGSIDHALALAIPQARREYWSWPAQRTDGVGTAPFAIPEGARFRLDPALDVEALNLPWIVKLMARAAQRYGIIVRDQSGVVTFYGEDPRPTGSNPYVGPGGYFSNEYPHRLVAKFPWGRLKALPHQLSCCWHPKT